MQPAVYIKRDIDFNKNFKGLLEVMKLIAVSEYHILERKLKTYERLQTLLGEFMDSIDLSQVRHPFLDGGRGLAGIVAVTSDAGLLGGMNMQVIARALDLATQGPSKLILIGERGLVYARDYAIPIVHFPGIIDTRRYEQAIQIRDYLTSEVLSGNLSGITVVFPRALSFVMQRVDVQVITPLPKPERKAVTVHENILFESSPQEIVEYLVHLILGQRLYEIFGMARLCEQAARFLHLEESCNKIGEMNKKLYLQYFRRRHEIIDANMRELYASRSLYAAKR